MKRIGLALMLLAAGIAAQAAVKTETVNYKDGKTALQGYLAYDDSIKGPRPAVLVVHEWKGFGDYVKMRAEQLAALGYTAFALDMYGKGVYAKNHEEAGKLSGVYRSDRQLMRSRATAGLNVLLKRPETDPKRVAAIGYCFGGTTVLELARGGADLAGVASFHGSLETPHPEQTASIKSKVLILQGAEDKFTVAGLQAFQDEMRRANADWQMNVYGGAVHSFTVKEAGDDPSKGMAYDEKADKRSWQALQDFLTEIFGK
jgi:dienelactone hydrolase